ncbi:MAG: hypothetical protein R2880_04580 [Deinococcales bacterium]
MTLSLSVFGKVHLFADNRVIDQPYMGLLILTYMSISQFEGQAHQRQELADKLWADFANEEKTIERTGRREYQEKQSIQNYRVNLSKLHKSLFPKSTVSHSLDEAFLNYFAEGVIENTALRFESYFDQGNYEAALALVAGGEFLADVVQRFGSGHTKKHYDQAGEWREWLEHHRQKYRLKTLEARQYLGKALELSQVKKDFPLPLLALVDEGMLELVQHYYTQMPLLPNQEIAIKTHLQDYVRAYFLQDANINLQMRTHIWPLFQHLSLWGPMPSEKLALRFSLTVTEVQSLLEEFYSRHEPWVDWQDEGWILVRGQELMADSLKRFKDERAKQLLRHIHALVLEDDPKSLSYSQALEAYQEIYDCQAGLITGAYLEEAALVYLHVAKEALTQDNSSLSLLLLERLKKLRRLSQQGFTIEEAFYYIHALERRKEFARAKAELDKLPDGYFEDGLWAEKFVALKASLLSQAAFEDEALKMAREFAARASESRDRWARAEGHQALGRLALNTKHYEEAEKHFSAAIRAWQTLQQDYRRLGAMSNLAVVHERSNKFDDVERVYDLILKDPKLTLNAKVRILVNKAAFHHDHSQLDKSHERESQRLLALIDKLLAHEAVDAEIVAMALFNKATIAHDRFEQASPSTSLADIETLLTQASQIAAAIQLYRTHGMAEFALGYLRHNHSYMENAIYILELAGCYEDAKSYRQTLAEFLSNSHD